MDDPKDKKKRLRKAAGETFAPTSTEGPQRAGELLKQARETQGISIEAVSAAIHIRGVQLRAIEDGNIAALPGMVYAQGFVKSYANYLQLDPAEILKRFKAEHGVETKKAALNFPEPLTEDKLPSPFVIGATAGVVVLLLILWAVFSGGSKHDSKLAEIPPPPVITPVTVAPAAPAPGTPPVVASAAAPEAPALMPGTQAPDVTAPLQKQAPPATTAAIARAPAVAAAATTPAITTPTATAAITPPLKAAIPAATAPAVPGLPDAAFATAAAVPAVAAPVTPAAVPAAIKAATAAAETPKADAPITIRSRAKTRVMLEAKETTWIEVADTQGRIVYKKVMQQGDTYAVPDAQGLSLITSNAGGLDIYVDGQPVPPIGKVGEIMRGVVLSPDELKRKLQRIPDSDFNR